jgi:hypothetical protein
MTENRPSNAKVALNNGIILGTALILFSLLLYILDVPYTSKASWISYIIIVIGAVLAIKQWRDKYNDGYLSYGGAFSNGFLTLLFAGILASVWTGIFFSVIAPGEIDKIIEATEEQMYQRNPNMSDSDLEMAMSWTRMMMKPWLMAIWGILGNTIAGLIISLIVAIFMKKEKPLFEE